MKAGFLWADLGRKVNRLFSISLMSHNIDFKTLRLCLKADKLIVLMMGM